MASDYDQNTRFASTKGRSTDNPQLLLKLPVVSQFYRILKDWQSEFKPRQYDNQYALSSIEWQDNNTQPRKH